ncbi:MAG: sulfur oxidation c-type cytochrome SoxA [Loktanella sp.]|nr:sulfur oxidation c-type cytochrome SoxA [Loktanella sp.]
MLQPTYRFRISTWLTASAFVIAGTNAALSESALDKYHEMLSDPFSNPAWFAVDRGEELWNTGLQDCDLGLGPGVVEGAYAQMPRYFEDAGRVMDADTRIAWCRETLQGIPFAQSAGQAFSDKGKFSEMQDLTAFVAAQSEDMPIQIPMDHAKEKEAVAIGEELFYRRASYLDYSCATCHGNTGSRIRLQELSQMTDPEQAGAVMASWPTYRVSHETVRTTRTSWCRDGILADVSGQPRDCPDDAAPHVGLSLANASSRYRVWI